MDYSTLHITARIHFDKSYPDGGWDYEAFINGTQDVGPLEVDDDADDVKLMEAFREEFPWLDDAGSSCVSIHRN